MGLRSSGNGSMLRGGIALLAMLAGVLLLAGPGRSQAPAPAAGTALLLSVQGGIGPAIADYLEDGFRQAAADGASLVILRLDTPGGLDTATRDIVQAMLASPVPIAMWVGPRGARAASADTFMLSAAHVAAMAPGTATGAATPVRVGGGRGDAPDALERKAVNDAAAYARGLAAYHGRNEDWVEKAVRDAASLNSEAALDLKVIDLVADDLPMLLAKADGMTVRLPGGPAVLDTDRLQVVPLEPDWQHRLLGWLTDPNVAYLLLLLGVYGLIFEFASPGFGIGGVVGLIALPLGLYAMNLLPVNGAGLLLVGLGVVLLLAEAFVPSFGVLGVGGAIAFGLGSAILFDMPVPAAVPGFRLSPFVLTVATAGSAAFVLVLIRLMWKAHGRPILTGGQGLLGECGQVIDWMDRRGVVRVHGERWQATSRRPLEPGQLVTVRARQGLKLEVVPGAPAKPLEEIR